MTYASNGSRIAAHLLDGLFISLLGIVLAFIPIIGLFDFFLYNFYFAFTEGGSMMASPGKKICGLMVVTENGQPLDFGRAFGRSFAKELSGLLFGIGYIIGLFDGEGKTMHDAMCGTRVIEASSYNPQRAAVHSYSRPVSLTPTLPKANSPKLVCISGKLAGQVFPIPPQGLLIGKDPAVCNVAVTLPNVSRSHCKVTYNSSSRTFVLQDLGSTNGTFLRNGTRLNRSVPYALNVGDEFTIAGHTLVFRVTY